MRRLFLERLSSGKSAFQIVKMCNRLFAAPPAQVHKKPIAHAVEIDEPRIHTFHLPAERNNLTHLALQRFLERFHLVEIVLKFLVIGAIGALQALSPNRLKRIETNFVRHELLANRIGARKDALQIRDLFVRLLNGENARTCHEIVSSLSTEPYYKPLLPLRKQNMNAENVIIIGSGPAGYTAAIYAARANMSPLLFEGAHPFLPGGQLTITTEVENYPGFPEGIMGPEIMERFRKQAERFGTKIISANVDKVDFSKRPFVLWSEGKEYTGKTIVVATGASAKLLGLPNEDRLMKTGGFVSACATCDGAFYKGKEVAVVGGGDTAMEEAQFLTRFATHVTIIHRREDLRASKIMQERARKNPKIGFLWNTVVEELVEGPDKKLKSLKLHNLKTNERSNMPIGGIFMAIGHKPNTDIFKGQLEMNEVGYIKVKNPSTYTSVEGVFGAGDAIDPTYRQAITAAGTGCAAAIDAERWLEAQGH